MASTIYSKAGADAAIAAAFDAIPAPGGGGTDALTVVTANTTPDAGTSIGQLAGYLNTSTASVTVAAVTLPAGQAVVLMWDGAAWVQPSMLGGTAGPVDTTAPTAGNLAASAVTQTGFTLTASGAADETELEALPYRFSLDGGALYGAWQASPVYVVSGLTVGTLYTCRHQVRDAAGNIAQGATIEVTTDAEVADTTAPTGAVLAVTGSGFVGSTRTLTVTGATDAESGLDAAPYRFSVDGQVTYSAWQAGNVWTSEPLDAGSYQPYVQVRDAAANVATVSAAAFSVMTEEAEWGTLHVDSFNTHPASTSLTGLALEQGGLTWQEPWLTVSNFSPITTNTAGGISGNSGTSRLDVGQLDRFELTFDFQPVGAQDAVMFYWNTTAVFKNAGNQLALGYGDGYYVEVKGAGEFRVRQLTLAADTYSKTDTQLYLVGSRTPLNTITPCKVTFDAGVATFWSNGIQRGTYTIPDWAPAPITPFAALRVSKTTGTHILDNFTLRTA